MNGIALVACFGLLLSPLSLTKANLPPPVVVIQTCDGDQYHPLYEVTHPANKQYAARHGYTYWGFEGVVRGPKPWQSSFNRIYLFEMAQQSGAFDWIFFLDNDALVVNHAQALDGFLDQACMIVAARGASDDAKDYHDINAGVMLVNLRHDKARHLLREWRRRYEAVGLEELEQEPDGSFTHIGTHVDDQGMLQALLKSHFTADDVCRQTLPNITLNYGGSFVQHVMRGEEGTPMADRTSRLKELAQSIINRLL